MKRNILSLLIAIVFMVSFDLSLAADISDKCAATHKNYINQLENQVNSYKQQGFETPPDIEMALSHLQYDSSLASSVSLTEMDRDSSANVVTYFVEGPHTDYSDYNRDCITEVLDRHCSSYTGNEMGLQCKRMEGSSSSGGSSGRQSPGGEIHQDENGVWTN